MGTQSLRATSTLEPELEPWHCHTLVSCVARLLAQDPEIAGGIHMGTQKKPNTTLLKLLK